MDLHCYLDIDEPRLRSSLYAERISEIEVKNAILTRFHGAQHLAARLQ